MNTIKLFLVALIATIGFSACNNDSKKAVAIEKPKEQIEKRDVQLKTLDDKTITMALNNNILVSQELNGKVVLVNFFATWCPPCIEEIPSFNKLYEKYGDKFEIVAVLYEKDKAKEEIEAFVQKHEIKFPVTISEVENFEAAKLFWDVNKIPESFLFSKEGFLLEKFIGIVNEEKVEEHIGNF
jgi:thiol-disulfide isomerase/thioredoxin